MSPPRMAHLSATLTTVFLLLSIFSAVIAHSDESDLPEITLSESDPQSTSTEIPFSNPNPQPEDSGIVRWLEFSKVEEDNSKTTDLQEPDVVVSDFPFVNRHWPGRLRLRRRHRRGCGHGRRFNQNREISYGNDMIASEEKTDHPDSQISSMEFDPRSVSLDNAEFKGLLLQHHHHDHDDQEHRIRNVGKFSWDKHTPREFDHQKRPPFDGEEDWQQHRRRRHHHHPRGQHHGGLMIAQRLRKFLDHF